MGERDFEHRPLDSIWVADAEYIYVGMADRAAFDKIAAPVHDHGENESGHALTKVVREGRLTVCFQYWVKSLTNEAFIARSRARREAANRRVGELRSSAASAAAAVATAKAKRAEG
jgi:hypothetical protein